ncbi:MAG: hypothetical protein KJ621_03470 [Proteobacteria bacterium]|nr:hypothetical protein [Pseudomonadota bacterium]MBU1742492.1 hypothetical protein [Pseudomonadota bacterium]
MNIRRGLGRLILLIAIGIMVPGFLLGYDYWQRQKGRCVYTYQLPRGPSDPNVKLIYRPFPGWKPIQLGNYFELVKYLNPWAWRIKPKGKPVGRCISFPKQLVTELGTVLHTDFKGPPVVQCVLSGAVVAIGFLLIAFLGLHGIIRISVWLGKGFKD